jgi:hypothetical protein
MNYDDIYEDAKLSIELDLVVRSIPSNKKKSAIKALKPLISKKAYAENKADREAEIDRKFGQDKCYCGNTKQKSQHLCHVCYANR